MSKRERLLSFREQMRQSLDDLRSIVEHRQSPTGDGRFTLRTIEIVEPGQYDARSIRRTRRALNLSQGLFAQLLGISGSLVRSWELGTRTPAPMARRLLDQVRADPAKFATLIRRSGRTPKRSGRNSSATRVKKVA